MLTKECRETLEVKEAANRETDLEHHRCIYN